MATLPTPTIPIVFHVGQSPGAAQQISDVQVVLQLDSLNRAFALADGGLARGVERGLTAWRGSSGDLAADAGKAEESGRVLGVNPNPTAGMTTVWISNVEAGERAEAAVYDALGRRVAVLHAGLLPPGDLSATLDTSALPAGVYVVRAVVTRGSETETLVRRLLVVR